MFFGQGPGPVGGIATLTNRRYFRVGRRFPSTSLIRA